MTSRRRFIALAGGAAGWVTEARAQRRQSLRRVGVLIAAQGELRLHAVREQLAQLGWHEGGNLQLIPRLTEAQPEQIKSFAGELVRLAPDVILAGSTAAVAALVEQTSSIPIVFATVGDPVGSGFVRELAHPGGNVTGFLAYEQSFSGKWLQLLKELVPSLKRALALYHPPTTATAGEYYLKSFEHSAEVLGVTALRAPVQTTDDVGASLTKLLDAAQTGVVVLPGPFVFNARSIIAKKAVEQRAASISPYRESAVSGGLSSYGIDQLHEYRQAAIYVSRVLAGERAGDLPIQQPTKFDLVLNNRTAKIIGLELPPTLLARADEVIE